MEKEATWFVIIFVWILISSAGASLASKKNRNKVLWFLNCLLSGLFGLLILACSRTLNYDYELDCIDETDDLGLWVFILCLVGQLFSLHYVYKLF